MSRYRPWEADMDLFQELQDALASGDMPFYTPASHSIPTCNDLGVDDGSDPDFGIELPSEEEPAPGSTHVDFQHFLTELLFSSPRLPFSELQKRAILSWAKELGARLNRCHEEIKNLVGNPTRKVVSASGNIFDINDIANSIAKDYANLLTRFAMQDCPEDGGEGMSQVFNGGKLLHELPSPPAIRVDGTVTRMLGKSGGWMVYNVLLIIFMDNVSGNISKQWNKHHVIYVMNVNLPWEMLEQEFYVHFMTSSPHCYNRNVAESGIIAWDCRDEEEVMLIPQVLFLAGDNPMQGNLRTPEGMVNTIKEQFSLAMLSGATEKVKTSVSTTGIRDSISLGILNTVIELGKSLHKQRAGTSSKPKSEVREVLEKELTGFLQGRVLEDAINPLLGMKDVNIHLDMPMEILHMILLGVMKYFWGQTVFLLKKANLVSTFQSRLDAIDQDRLNSLAQVMPFVIHDLVLQHVMDGWTSIGELVVLLWHTKIDNTDEYLINASLSAPDQYIYQANLFISKHSKKVKLGSHVIFLYPTTDSRFSVRCIIEVLIHNAFHRSVVHIAIQVLSFSALHPLIHLPCLELSDDKIIVSPDTFTQ
ncbi:hypothetical protein BKA82DRAFT_4330916 [Pisolithus tinctorius]|nr:hypothetical protein BKA82DRAFT_4330916 [Pisolithus tinctorius]